MRRLSWWPVHNRPQRLIKAVQSCFPASNPAEWFSAGCIFRWKFHRPKSNVPKVTRILKAIKSSQPHPQAPKISRLDQLASNWLGGATVPVWRPLHRPPEGIAAHASTSSWHNMATPLNMVKIRLLLGGENATNFPLAAASTWSAPSVDWRNESRDAQRWKLKMTFLNKYWFSCFSGSRLFCLPR